MFAIPYWLLPLGLVIWLAAKHWASPFASDRSKRYVAGLAAGSVVLPFLWPAARIPVAVFQVAICVYVALHRQVHTEDFDKGLSLTSTVNPTEHSL